jgi:hypothetical protein
MRVLVLAVAVKATNFTIGPAFLIQTPGPREPFRGAYQYITHSGAPSLLNGENFEMCCGDFDGDGKKARSYLFTPF